jgi:hypothetical protein
MPPRTLDSLPTTIPTAPFDPPDATDSSGDATITTVPNWNFRSSFREVFRPVTTVNGDMDGMLAFGNTLIEEARSHRSKP